MVAYSPLKIINYVHLTAPNQDNLYLLSTLTSSSSQYSYIIFKHILFCPVLLSLKESSKEKAPEKTTSTLSCACYTSLNGATERAEVRTFSGLPALIYKGSLALWPDRIWLPRAPPEYQGPGLFFNTKKAIWF